MPTGSVLYDVEEFGTLTGDAVEIDLNLPVHANKVYTVRQENPALSELYPLDFAGNVKVKDYNGSIFMTEPYQVLLVEGGTPVIVTVTEKDTGVEVGKATITNNVTFA